MRIAHFVHRYPPALGGAEAYFARLSRYLASQGEQVRVHTTNALDLEAFWSPKARSLPAGSDTDAGVEVRRYPLRHWAGQRYLLKLLSLIPSRPLQCLTVPCNPMAPRMWRDAGRDDHVDIVHATAFPYGFPIMCGLRLARRCGVPFVLTPFLHLGDPRNPRDRTRRAYLSPAMLYLLRAADRIFAQTNLERQALIDQGLPEDRLILLGMGVDPAECTGGNREEARQRWGIQPDEVVIGHLANKSVEKGTVDLLQAAQLLWQTRVRFRLLLAGPEMPNFLQYWRKLQNTAPARSASDGRLHSITRLGVLSAEEKRDFYSAIDIFALPSRSDSFGLVFLEAWANGVPCVAYRAGGVAEVIHDEQDGLLVDCGDVAGLGGALQRLTLSLDLRRGLGRTGRDRVLRDCRWEPKLEIVRRVYGELLGSAESFSPGRHGPRRLRRNVRIEKEGS